MLILKNNKFVNLFFSIIEATHRLPIVKCADYDGPKCARAVINEHWILLLSHCHAHRASVSCQSSFFCLHIVFSDITAKSEDNFNQKQTRHFFKVDVRIKFLARHLGEKKSNFPNFLLARSKIQSPLAIGRALSQSLLSVKPKIVVPSTNRILKDSCVDFSLSLLLRLFSSGWSGTSLREFGRN